MKYQTLCRNPNCLIPLSGPVPVKLYCNEDCHEQAAKYWQTIPNEQKNDASIYFEERFIEKWETVYTSPCFGIETELHNE